MDSLFYLNVFLKCKTTSVINNGAVIRPEVSSATAIPLGIDRIEHYIGSAALKGVKNGYAKTSKLDLTDPAIDRAIDVFIDHNVYFNATLTVIGGFNQSKDKWLKNGVDERKSWTPFSQSIVTNNTNKWNPPANFYEKSKIILKRFYDKGGLISMGTDGPLILDGIGVFQAPGFNTHR
ncbi:hypothetical protein [Aestuariivivens sediminis]|uniref:hypothetical protein n=1 Tax=Aestuariivivens sediminis TaxID=2913557 RepID=UPI001F591175|nr:hypothetical protein [Aestuariivivens sediminis]